MSQNLGVLLVPFALFLAAQLQTPQSLTDLATKYEVEIEVVRAPYSYESDYEVTALAPSQADLDRYAALFSLEWNRYPVSVMKAAKLKKIVIGAGIKMNGQVRAAVPAFEANTMLYDTTLGAKSSAYQRSVIHHEFFHLIDELQGHLRVDPEWAALNPKGFKYGNGGENMRTSGVGNLSDKLPGLLTPYSGSAIEEDKAELYAHLLVDRDFVLQRMNSDSVIAAKVDLLRRRMKKWDSDLGDAFWESKP